MKYEDLSFTAKNKDGIEVICDILTIVPNPEHSEQPYVIYTDYTMDENNEFIENYGKIINVEGDYVLKTITDPNLIELIKREASDEIVQYVNKQVQENLD